MIIPDINHYFTLSLSQVSICLVNVRVNRKGMSYIINMLETIDCRFKCNVDEFLKAPIVILLSFFSR